MTETVSDPFAPLGDEADRLDRNQVDLTPTGTMMLAPADAAHPKVAATRLLGREPNGLWIYLSIEGHIVLVVARWNEPGGGKTYRPLVWFSQPNGCAGWVSKHHPSLRPIYNMDQLSTRPDAIVIVCEGEKAADAAAQLFPACVAITSPGGAHQAKHADWSLLKGRKVLVVPDANDPVDNAGRRPGDVYADDVVAAALAAGAAEVHRVNTEALSRLLPDGSSREGPQGWDLADAADDGWPADALWAQLQGHASPQHHVERSHFISFGPFTMDPVEGLTLTIPGRTAPTTLFVTAPFEVLGGVRTQDGLGWSRLLRWRDADNRVHTHRVANADLHGDVKTLAAALTDKGLTITTGKGRAALAAYLNDIECTRRITLVESTGWHDIGGRPVFVLPDRTLGDAENEGVLLTHSGQMPYESRGSLQDWQEGVGQLSCGQTRLTFAISAAFAGMLLKLANLDGGGINLYGPSSIGKSTLVEAAASVHGRGGSPGFVRSWRATANGLEGAAALHTDTILILDELGIVEGKEASAAAYLLASGIGKGRSQRNGKLGPLQTWRTIVLSTGEIRLADKLRENNQRAMAGQAVRLVDVPADAGGGYGVFDDPGQSGTAKDLADQIKLAARISYGTAGPAFAERLIQHGLNELETLVRDIMAQFRSDIVPLGADGQVQRAADRFALIAAAGELARDFGIVPWAAGDAYNAAAVCFQAWLRERGGTEAAEITEAIAQVRRFIEAHGQSRFEDIDIEFPPRTITHRAGFRQGKGAQEEWFVLPEVWKSEVCVGLDPVRTAGILAERGMLIRAKDGFQSVKKIQGQAMRVYRLSTKILAGGADE